MPANNQEIRDTRMEVKELLKECNIYLASEYRDASLDKPVTELRDLFGRLEANGYEVLNHLPSPLVNDIKERAGNGRGAFAYAIQITDEGVHVIRSDGASKIYAAYDSAFNSIMTAYCFGLSPTAMADLEKNAKKMVAEFEADAAKAIAEIKNTGQDANAVLQKAREAASAEGVSQHAKIFQEEANSCRKIAVGWLVMAAISLVAFGWAGYDLFRESSAADNIWLFIITRGVLLSAVVYALFFCVKNYRANRHNYVVNKHRQNALRTYQVLVGSAASAEVHDIVLTHAARCIFEQRDTGYAKGGSSEGGNVVNFESARKVVKLGDGD